MNKFLLIIKSFFYRGDDFQPVYFWVTILMALIIGMVILRMSGSHDISDVLLISALGGVVTLLGIYNINSIKNPRIMADHTRKVLNDLKEKIKAE